MPDVMSRQDQDALFVEINEEIVNLGTNTKKNYEDLSNKYVKLKEIVDRKDGDTYDAAYIDKLSIDMTARQDALDKSSEEIQANVKKKLEELEIAFKRPGGGTDKEKYDAKGIESFKAGILSMKGGATPEKIKDFSVTQDEYTNYCKSFNTWLRAKGDERTMFPAQHKDMLVGSDPDGGYTVTPAMSNQIIQRIYESDPIRQLASNENITTDALEWLVDWDEMGAGWETETVTGDKTSTANWQQKRIPVHIAYARPRATQKLLEDSGINIESWIANKIAERLMRLEGAAFVTGDGVGKPKGFLTYANGTNYGQVEQVNMGAAADLTTDGFIAIKYSLIEFYLNRGTWLMNRLTVADTMKLKDGNGNYIWKPGLANDAQSTILGLPVRMSTTMPIVAANSLSIALADWAEAYMIVDRLGISVQRDPYTVKPFVEFYTRKRLGGDVVNSQAIKIGKIAA